MRTRLLSSLSAPRLFYCEPLFKTQLQDNKKKQTRKQGDFFRGLVQKQEGKETSSIFRTLFTQITRIEALRRIGVLQPLFFIGGKTRRQTTYRSDSLPTQRSVLIDRLETSHAVQTQPDGEQTRKKKAAASASSWPFISSCAQRNQSIFLKTRQSPEPRRWTGNAAYSSQSQNMERNHEIHQFVQTIAVSAPTVTACKSQPSHIKIITFQFVKTNTLTVRVIWTRVMRFLPRVELKRESHKEQCWGLSSLV